MTDSVQKSPQAPPPTLKMGEGQWRTEYRLVEELTAVPAASVDRERVDPAHTVGEYVVVSNAEASDGSSSDETTDHRDASADNDCRLPVYRADDTIGMAIATGRVFVRSKSETPLEEFATMLGEYGLEIERTNSWAPFSGWVRSADAEDPSAALAFCAIDDVHDDLAVEPELLRMSVRR